MSNLCCTSISNKDRKSYNVSVNNLPPASTELVKYPWKCVELFCSELFRQIQFFRAVEPSKRMRAMT